MSGITTASTFDDFRSEIRAIADDMIAQESYEPGISMFGWYEAKGAMCSRGVVYEPPDPEKDAFHEWAKKNGLQSYSYDTRLLDAFKAGRASVTS